MTIQELAAQREAAWLAAHPDGHEYEQHDLLTEAQEELADCWNYIEASTLLGKDALKGCLRAVFDLIEGQRGR